MRSFTVETLRFDGGTWVSGVHGAVAEFCVGEGKAIELDLGESIVSAATPRGAISFCLSEKIRTLAFGCSPAPTDAGVVVVAVSQGHAEPLPFFGLTCLGPDDGAIGWQHRRETLYNLGLSKKVGFGVRTKRPELRANLDGCAGMRWPALMAAIGGEIVRVSPTRVVRNPLGRIEVFTPIPLPSGASPQGPHTHFLPEQLSVGADLPPPLQIPDVYVPCAIHYLD